MNTTNLDRAWHRLHPAPCSAPNCECREPDPIEAPVSITTALAFYGCIVALMFFWVALLTR